MLLVLFALSIANAVLVFRTDNTSWCNGNETTLSSDIAYCTSFAIGLPTGGVLTPDNQRRHVTLVIPVYMQRNATELFIENRDGNYWFQEIALVDATYVVPGPVAYHPGLNRLFAIAHFSAVPGVPLYMYVDLTQRTYGFQSPPAGTTPYDLYWDGSGLIGVLTQSGAYYVSRFLAGQTPVHLIDMTAGVPVVNVPRQGVSLFPLNVNVRSYCEINCLVWEILPTSQSTSTVASSTSVMTVSSYSKVSTSSTVYSTSSTAYSKIPNSTSSTAYSKIPNSTVAQSTIPDSSTVALFSSRVANSTSSGSPSPTPSPSSIPTTTPPPLPLIPWDDIVYVPTTAGAIVIPGKFVVSPGSVLRLDLTGLDVQPGEVIPLFTFSSATGSFDSIEIESTTCRTLFAVLERTETTMNAVVLSSTSVCAAQVKAAIHSPH